MTEECHSGQQCRRQAAELVHEEAEEKKKTVKVNDCGDTAPSVHKTQRNQINPRLKVRPVR